MSMYYKQDFKQAFDEFDIGSLEHVFKFWRLGETVNVETIAAKLSAKEEFSDAIKSGIQAAAKLANKDTSNAFHNKFHFAEVFAMTFFMGRYAVKQKFITTDQLGLLMIAALIHDLDHDGTTNTIDGEHQQYRLERQSFDNAKSSLQEAGLSRHELNLIKAFVLATDVSGTNSPANSVKKYLKSGNSKDLDPALLVLAVNNNADMAALLHEADISLGVVFSDAFGMDRQREYSLELGQSLQDDDLKNAKKGFLEFVVGDQYYSKSAKALFTQKLNEARQNYSLV